MTEKRNEKTSNSNNIGVVVLLLFVIGQYAAMYIPAFVGKPPKSISLFISILWSCLFFIFICKMFNKKKLYGFLFGAFIGTISFFGSVFVAGCSEHVKTSVPIKKTTAWVQSELNENYMRSITKNECMYKTMAFLKDCDSDNCLKTMAGVTGDCVSWAQGSLEEFCTDYNKNFAEPYCSTGVLSERACKVIEIGKTIQCK